MPTPFYHLSIAQDLLRHPALPPGARRCLRQNWPAFLLGSTAPDVQTLSGQNRQSTHFFDLPLRPGEPAPWERMLSAYPELAPPAGAPAQAAFIAGYLCHLQADWLWVQEIFVPVFGPDQQWDSLRRRLYLHNVLRAYLDRQLLPGLPANIDRELARAMPQNWLPFVADHHLAQWRDFLAGQLSPGAETRTVEVFAARQGIAPEAFYRLLDSEEQMEREVFARLPRAQLDAYRRNLLEENIILLSRSCFPEPGWTQDRPTEERGDRLPPGGQPKQPRPGVFRPAQPDEIIPLRLHAQAPRAGNQGRRSST